MSIGIRIGRIKGWFVGRKLEGLGIRIGEDCRYTKTYSNTGEPEERIGLEHRVDIQTFVRGYQIRDSWIYWSESYMNISVGVSVKGSE